MLPYKLPEPHGHRNHTTKGQKAALTTFLIITKLAERYLGELPGHESLHEDPIHDFQPVHITPLQLLEVGRCEVAGAAVPRKAASAAVEVEVVVLAQVAVHGCAIQSACNVLADAQAILLYQAVLLAWNTPTKPA